MNRLLAGGRVDKIHQPTPLDVAMTVRSNSANYQLLISAEAQSPRLHFTSVKRPNPQTPPNFTMLMRKYLEGSRFLGVEQVGFDRILHMKFSAYDGEPLTLVIEVMGKHSNIILINAEEKILGVVKPVGRSKNRFREIIPGRQYVAPPAQNKANPLDTTLEAFDGLLADSFPQGADVVAEKLESWLVKTFTGMSPFLARELIARSGRDRALLGEEFVGLFTDVRKADFLPVLITDDMGRTIGFYAFPSLQYPTENQHERTSISTVADIFYNSDLPRIAFEQAKEEFVARVRKELDSSQRAMGYIQESIDEGDKSERFKQIGELILSQIGQIPEEAESVELVDYYDPSMASVAVKLDPSLSPSENAEVYFRRYHKAVSGVEALKDRMSEVNQAIRLLKRVLSSAESATSEEQIKELQEALASEGVSIRKQDEAVAEKQKVEFDGHKIQRVMAGTWEILIGQNSEANDYLITRLAKPNDMWFHVKASPSAHVIVRTNGKPESIPQTVLQEAAEQTARHSDSKHSSLVPVDYTLRKHVRKPRGAPAGKAIYTHEKTVYITPRS